MAQQDVRIKLIMDGVQGVQAVTGAFNGLEQEILQYGEGARCAISTEWKGKDWGHMFFAEVREGKIVYVDPQSDNTNYTAWRAKFNPEKLWVARIDGRQVRPEWLQYLVEERN